MPRIGVLSSTLPSPALRQGLRELGYVEGQNIRLEYRAAEGNFERLPALAAELAGLGVDIILAGATPAARAAQKATSTIPIVATSMGDPVRDGLVASLASPGGNITGNTFLGPELVSKRISFLKELLPRLSILGVLWNPDAFGEQTMSGMLKETRETAGKLGLQPHFVQVRGSNDFESAFATLAKGGADALFTFPSVLLYTGRARLVELAATHRLPAMCNAREFVELGGLIAYGASIDDLVRRAAAYVDKIIKGAKASDLPVEQPTKFELLIDLKTAKALGLTIPPSLLALADEVIE